MRIINFDDGERVMLMSWAADDTPRLSNLVRTNTDGTLRWRADLPGTAPRDCFIKLWTERGSLLARTFSGIVVTLDPETGKVAQTMSQDN